MRDWPRPAEGGGGLPAGHHRAFPLGIQALRRSRHRAHRLVRAHDRGPLRLAGSARLPGGGRLRLAHHRLARRNRLGETRRYTPFEFELTPHVRPGARRRLTLRVDDAERAFKLGGKQGYGTPAGSGRRRTWRRAERRPWARCISLPISTREGDGGGFLLEKAPQDLTLRLAFKTEAWPRWSAGSRAVTRR